MMNMTGVGMPMRMTGMRVVLILAVRVAMRVPAHAPILRAR